MSVMMPVPCWSRLAAVLSSCTLLACATSPKADQQPAVPDAPVQAAPAAPPPASTLAAEPEPRTLDEAEALLEKARADLDRLALSGAPPGASANASAGAQAERSEADAQPAAKAQSPCPSACRAFASLGRAADAVCRLDAEGGERCERARRIREDASRRVASCGCVQ
jgi:hypothetical protein